MQVVPGHNKPFWSDPLLIVWCFKFIHTPKPSRVFVRAEFTYFEEQHGKVDKKIPIPPDAKIEALSKGSNGPFKMLLSNEVHRDSFIRQPNIKNTRKPVKLTLPLNQIDPLLGFNGAN